MDTIRRFLWKQFGITLDRETCIVGGIAVLMVVAIIVFGVCLAVTHAVLFSLLIILCGFVVGILAFGGSYSAMEWGVSSKEERQKIEEEIALKQLRRRARDKHFER
jgi:hypothetical protein